MTDNITLPRALIEMLRDSLDYARRFNGASVSAELAALDAALAEPEQKPAPRRAYFETTTLPISISISPLPEPDAIARAVEAEREACAKVCETGVDTEHPIVKGHIMQNFGQSKLLARAIRARGSK
jgi:hypothetical protein